MMMCLTLQRHSRATCSNATPLSPISARSCVMMLLLDDDVIVAVDGTNASAVEIVVSTKNRTAAMTAEGRNRED